MYRGKKARTKYIDRRDEEARLQWVAYYLSEGDLDAARELGWHERDGGGPIIAGKAQAGEGGAAAVAIQRRVRAAAARHRCASERRKYRLLLLHCHIENKKAHVIQQCARRRAERNAAATAGLR